MGERQQSRKMPKGVTVRETKNAKTIYISFQYRGHQCREPLPGINPTAGNLAYAGRKRQAILLEIEKDTFNYADHFPTSRQLAKFGAAARGSTVVQYLEQHMENSTRRQLSPSTLEGYRKAVNAAKPLHNTTVASLTPAMIKSWLTNMEVSLKTARNRLSVLKTSLDEAITDGVIQVNPCIGIQPAKYFDAQKKTDARGDHQDVDPFSPSEVEAILGAAQGIEAQWANLFQFWFATGVRSSELIALQWRDVDWHNKLIRVVEAQVNGVTKGTKTASGRRLIELDEDAMAALVAQRQHTELMDDRIFHDPRYNRAWGSADVIRKTAWTRTLKMARVRYRYPYQCRHTFATKHISQGSNLWWLASQMGHASPEMLFRHYGSYLEAYDKNRGQNSTYASRGR